jgi:hypothetical protein
MASLLLCCRLATWHPKLTAAVSPVNIVVVIVAGHDLRDGVPGAWRLADGPAVPAALVQVLDFKVQLFPAAVLSHCTCKHRYNKWRPGSFFHRCMIAATVSRRVILDEAQVLCRSPPAVAC